ncbi:cytochrome P450 [Amylostereum chailletii]|nr:cytochrome P450 [Amylostereum chailletii]
MSSLIGSLFSNLIYTLGVAFVLYFVVNGIYQIFLSPLRHVPGPWYAAISDAWLTSHTLRLRQCRAIDELFEAYGPVVRVGPNKVVYNDAPTNKKVYASPKFSKSAWYKGIQTNDRDHAMTTLPHADHALRRKSFASHYTPTNLSLFQPELHSFVLKVVDILEDNGGKTPVDCLHLFREMLVDIGAVVAFDYKLGALEEASKHGVNYLVRAIDDFPKLAVMRTLLPVWAFDMLYKIPNQRVRLFLDSDRMMAVFIGDRVRETHAEIANAGKLDEAERLPLVHRLVQYRLPSNEPMDDGDIIAEHMGHFIAGTDTTSTSLAYLFWELSRRPDVGRQLRAELDAAMFDGRRIPDIAALQDLPYLNAVIKESASFIFPSLLPVRFIGRLLEALRLYGSAPSILPRIAPQGPFDIMGLDIPAGTEVATQSWSMHRNPAVFPSPNTFLPSRWLDASESELADMNLHSMPFGSGMRVCGGQNLAMMMLRIGTAALARNFEIVAPKETTDRSMDMRDSFVIFPAAMGCRLAFVPRTTA